MTVVDVPGAERFEARLPDGRVVGIALYQRDPGVVVFLHTEVEPDLEEHGVGSALVEGALDQVRDAGERVVALCPFVRAYILRHPEYRDLTEREA